MARRRDRGFTLIEMVIVVAIVVLLAGILVPIAFNQIDDAQKARALGDVRQIASALMIFKKDTGVWPSAKKMFYSDGTAATDEATKWEAAGDSGVLSDPLRANAASTSNWNGPYMSTISADPWGKRYIVEAIGLSAAGSPYGWVISAGPDGTFQTAKTDNELKGDDIGVLMR